MIEKIEAKIEKHINSILGKEAITHEDYMTLANELVRLDQKEKDLQKASESKKQQQMWLEMLTNIVAYKDHV